MRPTLAGQLWAWGLSGLLVFTTASLTGCDSLSLGGAIYDQNIRLPDSGWAATQRLVYRVTISEPGTPKRVRLSVRHDDTYPFYNLYLRYRVLDDSAREIAQGLHQILLLDAATGRPKGSGLGGVHDLDHSFLEQVRFPAEGTYSIKLEQYMRRDPLPGIRALGLQVTEER